MLTNSVLKKYFESSVFQDGYKEQLERFGEDIDRLFADDLRTKITFSNEVLSKMMQGKLHLAYMSITHFEKHCKTDEDRQILGRLIALCKNEDAMAAVCEGDYVFSEQFGYYEIIQKAEDRAVIKKAFSTDMTLALNDPRSELRFSYNEESLDGYQVADKKALAKIADYFKENSQHKRLFRRNTKLILRLRKAMINGGMTEAEEGFKMLHFYRLCGEKLAFAINLSDLGDRVKIGYGFAAVSDKDYLDHMTRYGIDNDWINLRECTYVCGEEDFAAAFSAIRAFYEKHKEKSKDEILAERQERIKAFIENVKVTLKPLGFKKKNSTWTRELGGGISFKIVLDKSPYADIFSFLFWVMNESGEGARQCYSRSLYDYGRNRFDWQFATEAEIRETMRKLAELAEDIISNHKALIKMGSKDLNEIFVCRRTGDAICENCPYKG